MDWRALLPGVWIFRDSCNVYAIACRDGLVVVNGGTGSWLDSVCELPQPVTALLCTHYFRDHAAGAHEVADRGIPVYVPEYEEEIFADPVAHFQQRESYIVYDNLWDRFSPILPTKVAGLLRDYETIVVAGRPFDVIPLPGVTCGQVGLGVRLEDGRKAVFSAEAIHSPGRMARIAPLQYNYNDLSGALQAYFSAATLEKIAPDCLFPSLGHPILEAKPDQTLLDAPEKIRELIAEVRQNPSLAWRLKDAAEMAGYPPFRFSRLFKELVGCGFHEYVDRCRDSTSDGVPNALATLKTNLKALMSVRPGMLGAVSQLEGPDLEQITDHVWLDKKSFANTWYLVSDSGKVMALDYGYHLQTAITFPGYAKKDRRRALLHGLEKFGRIDVVLVSHFHDDHVAGIPVLQRIHGTECWAAENFADLLEHPEAHTFPCNWPFASVVNRRLPLDEPFEWEEFRFHLAPMSGHTRFSALIGFEADGKRFAHTGDQYFFERVGQPFDGNLRCQNQVYRNGALLDGYEQSNRWMLDWKPDIVLQGHQPAMFTDEHFWRHIEAWSHDYADLARDVMPLNDEEPHFDLDSWGGWIWPYRVVQDTLEPFSVRITVRNPNPDPALLQVRLVGPADWAGEAGEMSAEGRQEVSCELSMTPTFECRCQPIAVELTVDGQPYGQVAEALVTVGYKGYG